MGGAFGANSTTPVHEGFHTIAGTIDVPLPLSMATIGRQNPETKLIVNDSSTIDRLGYGSNAANYFANGGVDRSGNVVDPFTNTDNLTCAYVTCPSHGN